MLELRPLLRFRHLEAAVDKGWETPYRFSVKGDEYEISHPDLPAALHLAVQPGQGLPDRREDGAATSAIPRRKSGASRASAISGAPAFSRWSCGRGAGHAHGLHRAAGKRAMRWGPEQAREYETRRRVRLLERAPAAARTGFAAELVLAADQFLIEPAGRAGEAALAHAAGGRCAHRHRRLPLVHGLGARHDDLAGRAGARYRPAPRGGVHPPHLLALCARRPDPEHVSGRPGPRALPHRGCDPLVLPRALAVHRPHARPHHACGSCCRCWRTSWNTMCAAPISTSTWTRRMPCSSRASRATNSPGWMRRPASGWSRRAGGRRWRSTRSGTMRSSLIGNWMQEENDQRRRRLPRAGAAGEGVVQRAVLVGGTWASFRRGGRRAWRRSRLPPEPGICDLTAKPGARSPRAGRRYGGGKARAAHAGRAALSFAEGPGVQTELPWRSLGAGCGVSPGDGVALAHRAVRRCDAEGASGGQGGSARGVAEPSSSTGGKRGIGTISEIFDAEEPHVARGCIAQAWSVAEVLRVWLKTE